MGGNTPWYLVGASASVHLFSDADAVLASALAASLAVLASAAAASLGSTDGPAAPLEQNVSQLTIRDYARFPELSLSFSLTSHLFLFLLSALASLSRCFLSASLYP